MPTSYVVLHDPSWEGHTTVEAEGSEQAVRLVANGNPGAYLAIPERSFTFRRGDTPPTTDLVWGELTAADGIPEALVAEAAMADLDDDDTIVVVVAADDELAALDETRRGEEPEA